MSRERLRVGLAGAGFLAATRARCWRRVHGVDVELVAVAASSAERAAAFVAAHGGGDAGAGAAGAVGFASSGAAPEALAGWEALVARDDLDVVDVCLPNDLHRPVVVAAAQAGKAVLCTKPLAAYVGQDLGADATDAEVAARDRRAMAAVAVGEARAMVEAAASAGVPLAYGENWVYAPAIRRAAGLLAKGGGRLLELRGEEAHSGSHAAYARSWRRAGGGALLRLGAHPVGAMLHLKAEEGRRLDGAPVEVVAVTAETADPLDAAPADATSLSTAARDTETWGCAVLHFADGTRGTAYGSDLALGGMSSQLELRASDARLLCRLSPHDQLSAYAPRDGVFGDAYVMEKVDGQAGWTTPLPDEDESSGQQAMIQAFAEDLAADRAPASDGALGLAVTRVLAAAYVSAAEHRRVELSELDGFAG